MTAVFLALRAIIDGLLFLGVAWGRWQGAWVMLLATVLVAEIVMTCADFVSEDRRRKLPPLERVLHTLLTIGYGVLLGVLVPVLVRWAAMPTAVHFVTYGWISWFISACCVLVIALGVRNFVAVRRLQPAPAGRAMPIRRHGSPAILITGATGFIGSALTRDLIREGQRVIIYSRDLLQARRTFGPAAWVVDRFDDIPSETRIDAVVHLAGAPVLGMPWTARRRKLLVSSRTSVMQQLVELMGRLQNRPRALVAASAVGFYGVPADTQVVDEGAPPQPGLFQSDLCAAIEHEASRAEATGIRVVRLRFGIVLGMGGGAYPGLAFAARLGLGSRLGSGKQPVPWIHLDDAVGLIRFAMEHQTLSGAVNAVAPDVTVQEKFACAMAESFDRRVRLVIPDWILRGLMGEMSELLRCGQWVVPAAAVTAGYRYRLPTLRAAMASLSHR